MTGTAGLRRSRGGTSAQRVASALPVAALLAWGLAVAPAAAQPTPPDSAAAQPSLPKPIDNAMPLTSPVIGGGSGGKNGSGGQGGSTGKTSSAGKSAVDRAAAARAARRRVAAHHRGGRDAAYEPLERPALAGVELVAPLPVPVQPPHFTVPTPAYLPDNAATFYTTPLPPVVCRRVPRDPYAPDPHLIRETTVFCEADNP